MEWPLREAKNRLSEVINRACDPKEGPQTMNRHGNKTVVILAYDEHILAYDEHKKLA